MGAGIEGIEEASHGMRAIEPTNLPVPEPLRPPSPQEGASAVVLPAVAEPPTVALARASRELALRAARRALQGLARGEPAPVLALGFSAGLLARTALRGLGAVRHLQSCQTLAPRAEATRPPAELLAVEVETLVIHTRRVFRRG